MIDEFIINENCKKNTAQTRESFFFSLEALYVRFCEYAVKANGAWIIR